MKFSLARGQVVLDLYRIVEPIKKGTTSEVYRIGLLEDPLVQYALKIAENAEDDNRFLDTECDALVAIKHPRVVGLRANGCWQGRRALVLDYYPCCLESVVGRMSVDSCLRVAREILEGLLAIHGAGWIHYDVKPANMLLNNFGAAVVADFSLSLPAGRPLPAAQARGTPEYIAPEGCTSTGLDTLDTPEARAATDFYSWGMLLYKTLVGRLPWDSGNVRQVMLQHAQEEPRPPSVFKPDLPEVVDRLVARAIAKNPLDRFPSSAELLNALAHASEAVAH